MVLERENWTKLSAETIQLISLAGLIDDGAPLIAPSSNTLAISAMQSKKKKSYVVGNEKQKDGFRYWLTIDNPFSSKLSSGSKDPSNVQTLVNRSPGSGLEDTKIIVSSNYDGLPVRGHYGNCTNGGGPILEDENEDLLADFIDEDSQLLRRVSKPVHSKNLLIGTMLRLPHKQPAGCRSKC